MSHDSTRKSFLAEVLGLAAVVTVAPGVAAASLVPASTSKAAGTAGSLQLRRDARAVARREGGA